MSKRRIDEKRFRTLDAELSALENEQGLDAATAERIRALYEIAPFDSRIDKIIEVPAAENESLGWTRVVLLTLSSLATLMLALAIFLLVGFNWHYLAPCWKTLIVIGSLAAVFGLGAAARWKKKIMLSELFFFGTAILYGVGIWQIAQIFHVSSHYPQGLWIWAVGVWLLAFAARTPLLPIFSAVLLCVWGSTEVSFFGIGPGLWRNMFLSLPNGAYSLPILAGSGWWFFHRRGMKTAASFYLTAIFYWGFLLPLSWQWDTSALWFWTAWAGLFTGLRTYYFHKSPLAPELLLLGFAMMGISFYEVNADILFDGFAAVGLTILGNLLALALAVWLISRRTHEVGRCFALGVLYFILWAICRYIDLFGGVGMIGASAFFLFLAATLFASAVLWAKIAKKRPAALPPLNPLGNETNDVRPCAPLVGSSAAAVIALAAVVMFGVLGEMILSRTVGYANAQRITVETAPVDPRDFFRGDYVTLNYDFAQTTGTRTTWEGDVRHDETLFDTDELKDHQLKGRTVYTVMKKAPDDPNGLWRPVKMTLEKPKNGVFLKGYCDGFRVEYGIDSFYVQEGTGQKIEKAMPRAAQNSSVPRDTNPPPRTCVLVDLLVKPNGETRITDLKIVTENN